MNVILVTSWDESQGAEGLTKTMRNLESVRQAAESSPEKLKLSHGVRWEGKEKKRQRGD